MDDPARKNEGIKVSVSGAKGEPAGAKDFIAKEIQRSTDRWSKFSGINLLNVNIEKHDSGKYSVKMEAAGEGAHHADAHAWELEAAMQEALAKMERELLKNRGKSSFGRFRRIFPRKE